VTVTICAPLRTEKFALRGAGTRVVRSGMGVDRSRRAAASLDGPVVVAGVGGGLGAGVRPGDLVVATEVRDPDGARVPCPSAPALAEEIRSLGLTVHLGPSLSARGVVDGPARRDAARTGALAVDTESFWLAVPGRPFAAVRAIVDTADAPLFRPSTVTRGIKALRALRRAAPAIGAFATGALLTGAAPTQAGETLLKEVG
jgi:4-hydroxy-3-methylbut-2-enyl diphosphate reductase